MNYASRPLLSVLSVVFAILFSIPAVADPYGPPFVVNTYTPGGQGVSRISVGANGDTAVLIYDAARGGTSFVRRYDAAGQALTTEEWQVGVGAVSVAVSGTGNFAIMRSASDGSGRGVFVTLYNRAGNVVVPEFRVNDSTADEQYAGAIAMNAYGQFAVIWSQSAGSGSSY
jgi:hypothetical protein